MSTADTIEITSEIRSRIEWDTDPESPAGWDNVGKIAYTSDRYTLGTEHVSRDRADEIARGIKDGTLVGLPVYAYVHSGAMISCGRRLRGGSDVILYGNPFSCPWDSGQSGFVYVEKAKAIQEFGKKILTNKVKAAVLRCMAMEVETFSQYLEGDVYTITVERAVRDADGEIESWETLETVCGFYGLDYAREEAKSMGEWQAKHLAEQAVPA